MALRVESLATNHRQCELSSGWCRTCLIPALKGFVYLCALVRVVVTMVGDDLNEGRLSYEMERQNTIVCLFDKSSPKISAYDTHEWIYETLKLPEGDVQMVQIDCPSLQVFIKFESADRMAKHLPDTLGTREYLHTSGELSKVIVSTSGIGYREIRIAGLPPEVPDSVLKAALDTYGDIRGYCRQSWSKQYRYQKANGVRVVTILLKKRVPSVLTIAGTGTLISHDGQEMKCFMCLEHGHISKLCPNKRPAQPTLHPLRPVGRPLTWAQVLRE
jgi:hypothetical protein